MTLIDQINAFRDARDWRQFHNEKDLALSLVLEASELLEIYQWKSAEEGNQNIEAIKDELADVLIYALMLADNLDLDVNELIPRKLAKNAIKYPIDKSRGQNKKVHGLIMWIFRRPKAPLRPASVGCRPWPPHWKKPATAGFFVFQ